MSIFSKVKVKRPKRSTFNLSHNSKLTFPWGQLIPTYWNYFEPNTSFKASSIIQCRTFPMIAPVMHEVNIYSYWFGVPLRLLMEESDYSNMITGGREGNVDSSELIPKFRIRHNQIFSHGAQYLLDYLDYPTTMLDQNSPEPGQDARVCTVDALPIRAYCSFYNNYFRDQNTTPDYGFDKFVGVKTDEEMTTLDWDNLRTKPRAWTKDYFTSALPNAQRGGNVEVPFSVLSDLAFDGQLPSQVLGADAAQDYLQSGQRVAGSDKRTLIGDSGAELALDNSMNLSITNQVRGTINDLRRAFAIQRWKERNALGGSRYIEQINAHFGVWADDYRLQRPIFLGGSRTPLTIGEVLQTSESTETSLQGTPSGRGYTMDSQGNVSYFCKEHMIIMNVICVVPKPSYFQGLPRKWDIKDRFDFVWPLLANIGEQEVRNSEIYYQSNPEVDDQPFGYQSRYAQYKFEMNRTHGEFNTSLLFWHLARKFADKPNLNRAFIECVASRNELNRIFPVAGNQDVYSNVNDKFWAQINFNIKVKRPLPYYSTPS